jgi:hypothetical protein
MQENQCKKNASWIHPVSIYHWPKYSTKLLLLLMFLSPPLRGAGLMALMPGHDWQHIYSVQHQAEAGAGGLFWDLQLGSSLLACSNQED